MTAYTDQAAIERYLQRVLTAVEIASLADMIPQVSDWIDGVTGRSWGPATITGEIHNVLGSTVKLNESPVSSIQSITMRSSRVGETPQVMVAGQNYELIDPGQGIVSIVRFAWSAGWYPRHPLPRDWLLTADYTVTAAVPDGIKRAATMMVSDAFLNAGDKYRQAGISEYQSGTDVRVKFTAAVDGPPVGVMTALARYIPASVFA